MRNKILTVLFLFISAFAKAQCPTIPCVTCVDSTRINVYYQCYDDYSPQCGCDGNTYRSICAALNWGGLINAPTPFPYGDGPCGNFDFEIVPNFIVTSSALNGIGTLKIYSKVGPVTALIQIYDTFGRKWYSQQIVMDASPSSSPPYYAIDINMDGFQQGIYYLFVTINGESHQKKLMKANGT